MRYSPAEVCQQEHPGNASALSQCLRNLGEPWWLGFAAVGVLLGAAAIGLAVFCCITRYQKKNEAVASQRRGGSRSPSPQVSAALFSDQGAGSNTVAGHTALSIAPPGGPF